MTTIVSVRRNGQVVIGGDGQVSLGNTVMKGNARKVHRLYNGKVLAGFAGGTADAFTLLERFEAKLQAHQGNLERKPGERKKIAFHKSPRTFRARYGDEIWILRCVWAKRGLDFERLPEIVGYEPPWWKAYKEGRLGQPPNNSEARKALTDQGDDT